MVLTAMLWSVIFIYTVKKFVDIMSLLENLLQENVFSKMKHVYDSSEIQYCQEYLMVRLANKSAQSAF